MEVDDHNLMAKQEHIEAIEAELDRMKKIATHVYEEMVSHMLAPLTPPRWYFSNLLYVGLFPNLLSVVLYYT